MGDLHTAPPTATNRHPADELGEIRETIRALKRREAALREILLAADADALNGADWTARRVATRRRTLDRDALPPEILGDARYWKETAGIVLRVARKERQAAQQAGRHARRLRASRTDDDCVIEPFD